MNIFSLIFTKPLTYIFASLTIFGATINLQLIEVRAQPALSRNDALQIWLDSRPKCSIIFIGKLLVIPDHVNYAKNERDSEKYRELLRSISLYAEIGISQVYDAGLTGSDGLLNLRELQRKIVNSTKEVVVTLDPALDKTSISSSPDGKPCLPASTLSNPRIITFDSVTGRGSDGVQWAGYVVQFSYRFHFTDLQRKIAVARHTPSVDGDYKLRAFFRFDPFKQSWTLRATDYGLVQSDYVSNAVPDALKRD